MTEEEIPTQLDSGKSQYRISKDCGISEAAIRYHVKRRSVKRRRGRRNFLKANRKAALRSQNQRKQQCPAKRIF